MAERPYRPPFELTSSALSALAGIMQLVGRYEGLNHPAPQPTLRRGNRIRTVVGSLAIEGNTLSTEQVTALLDHKRVAGSRKEILEVTNAMAAYEAAAKLRPSEPRDLLRAHGLMMAGLIPDAGQFRAGGVGIFRGKQLAHMAPPAHRVPTLVAQLLGFLRRDPTPPLVTSAVVHYELEFIHPFSDGNGRVGRLWQHAILRQAHPIFEFVPFESVVHARQPEYYDVLAACDRAGDATRFVELSLSTIHDALAELLRDLRPAPLTSVDRLDRAAAAFGRREFSRKDYIALLGRLSTATASRDLREGVDERRLVRTGTRALARYRFR